MKRNIIMFILGLMVSELVGAKNLQEEYPVIGQPIPSFIIQGLIQGEQESIQSDELKGRYIILDFWHRYCASCIASFPKMELFAHQFSDKMDVYMIGLEDDIGLKEFSRELIERLNLKHLNFAIDSSLFKRFVPSRAAPHLILISPDGKVQAITGSLDENMVVNFLNNLSFSFRDLSKQSQLYKSEYDRKKLFLMDGNGGEGFQFKYRSMLLDYVPNHMPMRIVPQTISQAMKNGKVIIEGVIDLLQLYRLAYFGITTWTSGGKDSIFYKEYYRSPIFDLQDNSRFKADINTGKNYYWYSFYLENDKLSADQVMNAMQGDLSLNFGYIARVEKKEMPYWKVSVDEDLINFLQTKGGQKQWEVDGIKLSQKFTNYPLIQAIQKLFKNVYTKTYPILVDINHSELNIDIEISDGIGNDFKILQEELRRYGINIDKSMREFKVLCISDTKSW
jgi:thiol-disulfide isomerase/thioredoxin